MTHDEIIREKRLEREQARYQALIAGYYDTLSDAQIEEDTAWGRIAESQFSHEEPVPAGDNISKPTASAVGTMLVALHICPPWRDSGRIQSATHR